MSISLKDFTKEVKAQILDLAKEIDFEGLESKGIIKKKGAWYQILQPNKLPQYARIQVTEIKFIKNKKEDIVLVKFNKARKRAQKLAEKIK